MHSRIIRSHSSQPSAYHCQSLPLGGHRYADIMPQARALFRALQKKTKRRPYIRSAYFKKDKVFFEYLWTHLNQKSLPDRARRLRYLPCALEVLQKSRQDPITFVDSQDPDTIRHQFSGVAGDGSRFAVIVKQERASGRKHLLSLFPIA